MACPTLSVDLHVGLEIQCDGEAANASSATVQRLGRVFERIAGMCHSIGTAAAEASLGAGDEAKAKERTARDGSSWLETSEPCL